jgi:hypothetical protein
VLESCELFVLAAVRSSSEAVTPRRDMLSRILAIHGVTSFRFWLNKNALDYPFLAECRIAQVNAVCHMVSPTQRT